MSKIEILNLDIRFDREFAARATNIRHALFNNTGSQFDIML